LQRVGPTTMAKRKNQGIASQNPGVLEQVKERAF
jgi:hypothetical protein